MSNAFIEEDQKLPHFAVLCYFHVKQVNGFWQRAWRPLICNVQLTGYLSLTIKKLSSGHIVKEVDFFTKYQ